MTRAQSLRQETALNSITPERAGGIMYDTAAYINQMQLLGGNPLTISKVYDSIEEMDADDAPVSDITGQPLKAGQIVSISTGDSTDPEDGLVYRFDGIVNNASSWTPVGKIGSDPYLEGFQYMGKAVLTPTPTDPGVPTQKVFYQATEPGTYTNFGGIVVADGEVVNLKWDGTAWSKDVTGAATKAEVEELGHFIDNTRWLRVLTDSTGKFLAGIKADGSIEWALGIPTPVREALDELSAVAAGKVDKVAGKSLIQAEVADDISVGKSLEFISVELDEDNHILGGRKKDGVRVESHLAVDKLDFKGRALEDILEEIEESVSGADVDVIPFNDVIFTADGRAIKVYNPYMQHRSNQYTGQLHCHCWTKFAEPGYAGKFPYGYYPDYVVTLTQEQREALIAQVAAEFVQRHKDLGYDFMTLSDYGVFEDLTPKPTPFPANFLWMWSAYETTSTDRCHVIVWAAPTPVIPYGTGTFADVLRAAQSMGAIVELPHPFDNEMSSSPEVLDSVKKGLRFVEVYDGVSLRKWRPDGTMFNRELVPAGLMIDAAFDYLISRGHFTFATAISDERPAYGRTGESMVTENPAKNLKNGCVKVFADNLSNGAIYEALMSGNFYAASDSDVEISGVRIEDGKYIVDVGISGVVVEFLRENNTVVKSVTTEEGSTSPYYDITGDEKFVRARIYKINDLPYDANYWYKNKEWMIWTQPLFISKTIIN